MQYLSGQHISVNAASASFFIALAIFPTLVLLLGLVRYTGYSVESLTELLEGVVPAALKPTIEELIFSTYRNTTGTLLSISALTALWSAGRGVYGLLGGMNAVYGVQESRRWVVIRAVSTLYTFVFLLVLLLTLVLYVLGKGVTQWLNGLHVPVLGFFIWLFRQRFVLMSLVLTLAFTAMYMFLPNKKNRFKESLPGAVFSAVGWQLVSTLFSVYVVNFDSYANLYGSVYALVLGLLWLYLCVCILFYGAALNRWLKDNL